MNAVKDRYLKIYIYNYIVQTRVWCSDPNLPKLLTCDTKTCFLLICGADVLQTAASAFDTFEHEVQGCIVIIADRGVSGQSGLSSQMKSNLL